MVVAVEKNVPYDPPLFYESSGESQVCYNIRMEAVDSTMEKEEIP